MKKAPDKLAVLSDVGRRLATIQSIDEAKEIPDQAEAIRINAKSAKKGLAIQNRAAAIKIQSEQRAGELLAKVERKQGKGGSGLHSTLERSGIPGVVGHRWQKMATVATAKVKELEAELTEKGEELTSTLVYRHAIGGAHVSHNTGEMEWYTSRAIVELARTAAHRVQDQLVALLGNHRRKPQEQVLRLFGADGL